MYFKAIKNGDLVYKCMTCFKEQKPAAFFESIPDLLFHELEDHNENKIVFSNFTYPYKIKFNQYEINSIRSSLTKEANEELKSKGVLHIPEISFQNKRIHLFWENGVMFFNEVKIEA